MTADLDHDVYIVCDCEARCRKDQHPISSTLLGEQAPDADTPEPAPKPNSQPPKGDDDDVKF